ncbi:hypothetical protein AB0N65_03520 [Paenarthrobacter sp. NPDC089322]|uniref:hypothetical protein n=1 Tax=Paenarthrobacter sp. NPDC089322 TaxID=3155065 RepID=UPI00341EFC73
MDLRDAAQQLYAVLPRDFTSERTALARRAKDSGDKDLAKEITGLPKPAAGAWAINMLAVHKPEVIDAVVRFGASLRAAQEDGDAEAFRELGQQRQGQLTSAVHSAKDLASELGAVLSAAAAADVEQTFRAVMADAGAAAAVGTGRLVRALSGSGFESVDLTDAVAAASPEDTEVSEAPTAGKSVPRAERQPSVRASKKKAPEPVQKKEPEEAATSLAERRAEKRRAALEEARNEFEAADTEARDAENAAARVWDDVKELAERRSELEAGIADVKKRLAAMEAELIGITRDAEAAESKKKLAVRAATQQRRAADQARRRVDRLS